MRTSRIMARKITIALIKLLPFLLIGIMYSGLLAESAQPAFKTAVNVVLAIYLCLMLFNLTQKLRYYFIYREVKASYKKVQLSHYKGFQLSAIKADRDDRFLASLPLNIWESIKPRIPENAAIERYLPSWTEAYEEPENYIRLRGFTAEQYAVCKEVLLSEAIAFSETVVTYDDLRIRRSKQRKRNRMYHIFRLRRKCV